MPEKYNFTNVLDVTTSNISWELHLKSVNLFMTDKQKDDIFSSFITDEISDFNSNVYYTNPDYLRCSYLEGKSSMYGKMLWKMRTFPNRGDIIHNMLE